MIRVILIPICSPTSQFIYSSQTALLSQVRNNWEIRPILLKSWNPGYWIAHRSYVIAGPSIKHHYHSYYYFERKRAHPPCMEDSKVTRWTFDCVILLAVGMLTRVFDKIVTMFLACAQDLRKCISCCLESSRRFLYVEECHFVSYFYVGWSQVGLRLRFEVRNHHLLGGWNRSRLEVPFRHIYDIASTIWQVILSTSGMFFDVRENGTLPQVCENVRDDNV